METKFIFTFGTERPFWDKYVEVWANGPTDARNMMCEAFGNSWAFIYGWDEWNSRPHHQTRLAILARHGRTGCILNSTKDDEDMRKQVNDD